MNFLQGRLLYFALLLQPLRLEVVFLLTIHCQSEKVKTETMTSFDETDDIPEQRPSQFPVSKSNEAEQVSSQEWEIKNNSPTDQSKVPETND